MGEWLNVGMFELRVETTRTTGKNNLYLVRGLTRPRFFCVGYNCLSAIEKEGAGGFARAQKKSCFKKVVSKI